MTQSPRPDILDSSLCTSELLQALATEIDAVVDQCRALEVVVAQVMAGDLPPGQLHDLQVMDLVIQRLEGTAGVLGALATHAPSSRVLTEPVLGGLSLSGLATRLSGGAQPTPRDVSGAVDIW